VKQRRTRVRFPAPPQITKAQAAGLGFRASWSTALGRRRSDVEKRDVVPADLWVAGGQGESFAARLRDQHAIERVTMEEREPTGDDSVFGGNGQMTEPVSTTISKVLQFGEHDVSVQESLTAERGRTRGRSRR
jgi:hypothetical protein